MKRMTIILVLAALAGLGGTSGSAAAADAWTVTSPDGALEVRVAADPAPTLTVLRGGRTVIEPSPFGLTLLKVGTRPGALKPAGVRRATIDETYRMPTGKRSVCRNHAHEMTVDFGGGGEPAFSLIVRAYNEGAAYRYVLRGEGTDEVVSEASAFRLPPASSAWFAPYSPGYEMVYAAQTNWTSFAKDIQVPLLFRHPAGPWILLTEAAVDGTYSGARLHVADPAAGLLQYRLAGRPGSSLPWTTPWRVAMVAESPGPLVESTLVTDLSPASKIEDTSWIRPGAAIFPWLTGPTSNNMSFARMQQFVDLAADMGWGWIEFDTALVLGNQMGDPPEKWMACTWVPELAAYANRRGVSVYGWDHWKNLDTPEKRERILGWHVTNGFKGIKIDFLDSDSQDLYRFRDVAARECAQRHLMLSYHGDITPRGLQRTWPNIATHEGVKGEEYYSPVNAGGNRPPLPAYNVNLVFTRNIPGSMDYTPVTFDLPGGPQGPRQTSNAHEMALAVVFESGWQGLGLNPESARGPAAAALGFLRNLPSAWDDIRFLGGHPEAFAAVARRKGNDWWIAGINAGESRALALTLDFLRPGTHMAELYRDDPETVGRPPLETRVAVTPVTVDPARPFAVSLPPNGGFGLVLRNSARPGR
ncbi:MAG: glycoside hydrolase family 97 protein [Verrucomicrobia bacterium]|nr:glycoside hydrolase family 97 protein [Verrucomicrobiota bacterium]